ncbi:MAG: hypothetical protein WCS15_07875 [Prevotella sp.]
MRACRGRGRCARRYPHAHSNTFRLNRWIIRFRPHDINARVRRVTRTHGRRFATRPVEEATTIRNAARRDPHTLSNLICQVRVSPYLKPRQYAIVRVEGLKNHTMVKRC